MKILCQRDPQWASVKLGASALTMGRYGCTTTCMSMLTDYFTGYMSPPEIAKNVDWYTPTGLVLWTKLDFKHMKFVQRFYSEDKAKIAAALKDPSTAVILEVDHSHWLVALSKDILGGWRVADPWDGKKKSSRAYRKVTGGALFRIK